MKDPSLERVEALFQAAADLPAAQRDAFLDRECDDAAAAARVRAMLQQLDRDESLRAPGGVPYPAPVTEGPGTVIGRYKLLQRIGEGGFGVVYMAEQREPVVRKVALKIIKLGMDTREVVARFEAERQALAMMDHPNIAKVLDGGATDTGRPFFVMELVRGVSITAYCDENNVSASERLRLFESVCHAVQHAHQKGVIHRDLKPSNVLVTLNDGEPMTKVIDFGVAKATHTKLTEKTLFTQYERFIGTPAYMSPEQAEMSAMDVDTRTDIYSLGVLLYELLTGTTPFDTTALFKRGISEVQRVIREEDPVKPSVRISTSGDATIARRRSIDVRGLSRLLKGDLDWIVMKALAKERNRHYATALDFASDIRRHLENSPVLASPPSAAYRVRKFLSRNRAAVSTAALILILLIAGIVGTTAGMMQSLREANNARVLTDFLIGTLALADPEVARDPSVTVRTLLDRASSRVDDSLPDQPHAQARVHGTIGQAYASLGVQSDAEFHLRRAVELHQRTGSLEPVELYSILWAWTHVAFQLQRDDAFSIARRARAVAHDHIRSFHPRFAALLDEFDAEAFEVLHSADQQHIDRALVLFERCVQMEKQVLADDDPLWPIVADTYVAAGFCLWYGPFEADSIAFWEHAYDIQRRTLPKNHADIGKTLGQLVGVLTRSRRLDEAERRITEGLEVMRANYEQGNFQLAFTESMLGHNYVFQQRYEEAEELLLRSHEALLAAVEDHSTFYSVDSYGRVIGLYEAWGKSEKAAPYRQTLAGYIARSKLAADWPIARQCFGPEHGELIRVLDEIHTICGGHNYEATPGQVDGVDLDAQLDSIVRLRGETLADDEALSVILGRRLLGWANALAPGAQDATRRRMAAEAKLLIEPWAEAVPLELAGALALLSETAADAVEGARRAREAWGAMRRYREGDNWLTASTKIRVAQCLVEHRLYAEAESILVPALALLGAQLGKTHRNTDVTRAALIELYTSWGKPEQAAEYQPKRP